MTPDQIGLIQQDYWQQQDAIAQDYYALGMTDATARELPAWIHEAYLSGYIAGVRQLECSEIGEIIDRSPALPDPSYRTEDEF